MCLVFLAMKQHAGFPFILAANRDEFYNRPAAPAHIWSGWPDVVAGQDLGTTASPPGTWLGMTTGGKICLLTNYRDLSNIRPQARSRGELVTNFLTDHAISQEKYLQTVRSTDEFYNGFNLVFGTVQRLTCYSSQSRLFHELTSGIFGLSNALLDSPWPKVQHGKDKMQSLTKKPDLTPNDFFSLLANEGIYEDHLLPETGVGLERERRLSAAFIRMPGYGTRCSTVIMCDEKGKVLFAERTFDPLSGNSKDVEVRFEISKDGEKI